MRIVTPKRAIAVAMLALVFGPIAAMLISGLAEALGASYRTCFHITRTSMCAILGATHLTAFRVLWRARQPEWWSSMAGRPLVGTATVAALATPLFVACVVAWVAEALG